VTVRVLTEEEAVEARSRARSEFEQVLVARTTQRPTKDQIDAWYTPRKAKARIDVEVGE
jgi:hypothetical protein